MISKSTRTPAWIFIISLLAGGSTLLTASCAPIPVSDAPEYPNGPDLAEWTDPLAGTRPLQVWIPPRQFAVYIHPHVDPRQDVAIGGHWILMKLAEGSWHFEDPVERPILADAEIDLGDVAAAREALGDFSDVVVPYRPIKPGSTSSP